MTNTENQIEEIINKVRTIEFLHGVPVSLPSETIELLRSGIRRAINQARAEERERMMGEMDKMKRKELSSINVGPVDIPDIETQGYNRALEDIKAIISNLEE